MCDFFLVHENNVLCFYCIAGLAQTEALNYGLNIWSTLANEIHLYVEKNHICVFVHSIVNVALHSTHGNSKENMKGKHFYVYMMVELLLYLPSKLNYICKEILII